MSTDAAEADLGLDDCTPEDIKRLLPTRPAAPARALAARRLCLCL